MAACQAFLWTFCAVFLKLLLDVRLQLLFDKVLAEAKRDASLELVSDFIKELIIVHLVDDEVRYVTLFCLLDEVVEPAIVV